MFKPNNLRWKYQTYLKYCQLLKSREGNRPAKHALNLSIRKSKYFINNTLNLAGSNSKYFTNITSPVLEKGISTAKHAQNLASTTSKYFQNIKSRVLEEGNNVAKHAQNLPGRKSRYFQNITSRVLEKGSNAGKHAQNLASLNSRFFNNITDSVLKSKQFEQLRNTVSAAQISSSHKTNKKDCNKKSKITNFDSTVSNITKRVLRNRLLYGAVAFIETKLEDPVTPPIPEPPPIPDVAEVVGQAVNALGEPTFASLGLGGWTPVGIVQNCFELLHVSLGVPWWAAIVIGTIVIRMLMLPLVVMAQRNAAKMNNNLPQMQAIQSKLTDARLTGNQLDAARYSQELMMFMNEKGLNPLKNMIVPFAQMPIFISFFMGLREMANVPVESMRTGGLFWFKDLTVPDEFFIMPVITSLTMWATIELGTDSAKLTTQNMQLMKYAFRAIPVIVLVFTVNFPGAILCYWVSSNFISLAQVGILRLPKVRDYFHIDPLIKHDPLILAKPKGFREGLKESWTNIKVTKELEERRKLDEMQFQRAGKGPVIKTYKYDPTKQITNPNAINAKER